MLMGAAGLGVAPVHAADTAAPPVVVTTSRVGWFASPRSDALLQIGTLPNKLALTIAAQNGTASSVSYDALGKDAKPSGSLAGFVDRDTAHSPLFPHVAQPSFSWFSPPMPTVMPEPGAVEAIPATAEAVSSPARFAPATSNAPNLFGSEAIRIGKTALDAKWRAVADVRLGSGPWSALVAHASGDALQELAAVNRWVNHQVRFADDAHGDRWSYAAQTLRQHRGDCEDYAIAKMQILRAMGFAENDLYLVIARDLVRRADHALLAVRVNDRFVVLESGTDALLDGTVPQDYRPIFTFSGNRTWIHGYKAAPTVIALAAVQPMGRAN